MMSKHSKKAVGGLNKKGANWTQLSFGGAMGQGQRVLRRLSQVVGTVVTTAGGLAGIRVLDSQAANAAEWSSMASVYVQYRVLAIRVYLQSFLLPATAGTDLPVFLGTDRSGALASPGSVPIVWALHNPKVFKLNNSDKKPISYEARAIDLEDQLYTPVGAPVPRFAIQALIVGNGILSAVVGY